MMANACERCGKPAGTAGLETVARQQVCATCKSEIVRGLLQSATGSQKPVGLGRRLRAGAIDALALTVVTAPALWELFAPIFRTAMRAAEVATSSASSFDPSSAISGLDSLTVSVAQRIMWAGAVYFGARTVYDTALTGRFSGTLGEFVTGSRVVAGNGRRVSYERALARSLTAVVSDVIFGLGYLVALVDKRKRTLHDLVAGTLVVDR